VLENPVFWVLVELPGGDEYPPGDANHVGLIFVFSRFWENLIGGKDKGTC